MTTPKSRDSKAGPARGTNRRWLLWTLAAAALVLILVGLYAIFSGSTAPKNTGAGKNYDVGQPGPGQAAPAFTLQDNSGKQVSLGDYKGKNVLLYFQEGLTCQPCWDQMTILEKDSTKVKAAGIDAVLSITTDPADLIARKTRDMGLSTPVLSDPALTVSEKYSANRYGMMGAMRDGHSFILVGPDGTIRWRADYGGAPDYTMFVPVDKLLSDLNDGIRP
ncbi:peroxiredoxin family protein [Pseudarthrobacter sp. AL07]|uniref:peroxiredoxin family protein n=1 Tax=unclassified Pseudarthrobacter TaxID=2647000 RepID=UPI00249A2466|nr:MULTISPECIES: peroxiredoxin family protein [unclassified Pseudarthrobacter]MDI3195231.1 peroxiredoxin family protein [Pseudarthrobacter sp. AL20]MDI3209297.1 peroxiredoxin family protein [Pseudarthrobacter sp. AL07]